MRRPLVILLTILIAGVPSSASAWGFEAHRFIIARTIPLLPAEIRPFFQRYETYLVEHVIDPDLWRTAGWEAEPPRHFVDLDAYGPPPFTNLPRDFDEAVRRHGREFVERNGTLPWRSQEIYGKLVEAFTQKAGYSRENIKFFTAVLGHYIADAHVPFHAVLNYDGQLTGQWGIHARFESELFERYRTTIRAAPRMPDRPRRVRDFVFDILMEGFPLAARILEADKVAVAGREVYDDEYFAMLFSRVRPILEDRLAASIGNSAAVITSAWIEAGRPGLPLEGNRTPRKVRTK
jgi:hypothetical protein